MHAEALGKYKFILQSFAVVGLLVHYAYWGSTFLRREFIFSRWLGARVMVGRELSRAVFPPSTGSRLRA